MEGTTSFWGASFDRGADILEDIIGKGRTQLGTWSGVGEKSRGTSHGEGNNCLGTSSGEGEQPSGDLIWGGETLNWRHHTGRGNAWGPLDLSGLHLIARLCAHISLPDSAKLSINWGHYLGRGTTDWEHGDGEQQTGNGTWEGEHSTGDGTWEGST